MQTFYTVSMLFRPAVGRGAGQGAAGAEPGPGTGCLTSCFYVVQTCIWPRSWARRCWSRTGTWYRMFDQLFLCCSDLQLAAELGKALLERNRDLEAQLYQAQQIIEEQQLEIDVT